MRKVWKAVLAAALMLSVGTAWAADSVVEIVGLDIINPTVIGEDVVYNDGSSHYWTKSSSQGTTGYGVAKSLTVSGESLLHIGYDGSVSAVGDIVVDFGDGAITIGDAASAGTLVIGGDNTATNGVAVSAGELRLLNGRVTIGSSPLLESGKTNLLSLTTLDLDNSDADVHLIMEGDGSRLEVSGVAFIGAGSQTGSVAELAVAGEASFGGGIVLGHGGILWNYGGASTEIMVGSVDDGVYAAGNIYMIGDSVLDGTANELVIMDKSAEESASGAPLSSLIITGEENRILGVVDVSSLKEMLVDGQVRLVSDTQVTIRDFRQVSGYVRADDVFSDSLLVIEGETAVVTGGLFESNVTFTNEKLKSFDFEGTGIKDWLDERAILDGGANTITGVTGANQTVNIGNYAGMVIGGGGQFVDINVNVAKGGSIYTDVEEGDLLIISSNDASAPVKFVVESATSFEFDYESLYVNGTSGAYDNYDADNPLLFIQAGANATVDIPDYSFSGMFGYFKFASTADDTGYGLVDYEDSEIDFDGSRADADNARATLIPVYGDAVNSGLSDMAYRAALGIINGIDPDFNPSAALQPLRSVDSISDSTAINSLNLLNIAAGRADMSIVSLYNGSNVFGVNQVSVSTAMTHIQTGMRRSDELRRLNAMLGSSLSGTAAYASDIINQCYANRFWAGGFGLWEDAGAYSGFEGYKYKSAGVSVGYDRMFGPSIIVGGSFAAAFGDYEDKSALAHDSGIDSYSFNAYATYTHHSGFFGSLFGGYTYSDNDIRELRLHNLTDLAWNTAKYHTNTWALGGKLGYDVKPVERFVITPSIGLTWISARSSAHTEHLADEEVARLGRMKTNQTYLPVELGFGYDAFVGETGKLTLSLNLGYAYNFNNDPIEGDILLLGFDNATPYAAVSRAPGHHTFTVGGGLRYAVGRFDIGAKYDYARKTKADSHRVYGTIGISF